MGDLFRGRGPSRSGKPTAMARSGGAAAKQRVRGRRTTTAAANGRAESSVDVMLRMAMRGRREAVLLPGRSREGGGGRRSPGLAYDAQRGSH